jgi:tetratricopeptide (TPR) repeat protein
LAPLDPRAAIVHLEEDVRLHRAEDTPDGVSDALEQLAIALAAAGDYERALAASAEAIAILGRTGDETRLLRSLAVHASYEGRTGRGGEAVARLDAVLDRAPQEDRETRFLALLNRGAVQFSRGRLARAYADTEAALALAEAASGAHALAAGNLGAIADSLGDFEAAERHLVEALEGYRRLGDRREVARCLGNLGVTLQHLGDLPRALACMREALAEKEAVGDEAGATALWLGIGRASDAAGDVGAARDAYTRAQERGLRLGHRDLARVARANVAEMALRRDGPAVALALATAVLDEVEPDLHPEVATLAAETAADALLALGSPREALAHATRGIRWMEPLLEGQSDVHAMAVRARWSGLFGASVRAAVEAGDLRALAEALESERSMALLEALRARATLAEALPESLRLVLAGARRAKESALAALAVAMDLGAGEGRALRIDAARRDLTDARDRLDAAVARIQREQKGRAGALLYPRPDDLATLERRLASDEALVLYGRAGAEAIALVVESGGSRLARLGPWEAVESAALDLVPSVGPLVAPGAAPGLAKRIVEPLALGPETVRLLVSPTGPLAYVPFALLTDREVVLVPSGTTWRELAAPERGDGVLGLGDPAYPATGEASAGVSRLWAGVWRPLPASRREVERIASERLLGEQATRRGLVGALARRPRWRAVHLACHGLVDRRDPLRSALALAPEGDDGMLTCLDVAAMHVPADLVVLSGCETALGTDRRAEGIVGLVRAFMLAGGRSVLASLWDVEDEATEALMVRFYEAWTSSEAVPASRALAIAQARLREDPRWSDARHWAGWVLWGAD